MSVPFQWPLRTRYPGAVQHSSSVSHGPTVVYCVCRVTQVLVCFVFVAVVEFARPGLCPGLSTLDLFPCCVVMKAGERLVLHSELSDFRAYLYHVPRRSLTSIKSHPSFR